MMDATDLPKGFLWSGVSCGIKQSGRPDLGLAYSSYPATVSGVFTRNSFPAAPVREARRRLRNRRQFRGLIVNSGVANAATGEKGLETNRDMIESMARHFGIDSEEVLSSSTGVIGDPLPVSRIKEGIPDAVDRMSEDPETFSRAIMTTDSVQKIASRPIEEIGATLLGVAKGSGMIRPDMATMLAFLFLDHPVEVEWLDRVLTHSCKRSFNQITVDEEMSTNDTVLVFAAHHPDKETVDGDHPHADALTEALQGVCGELARSIVQDGEGATRVIEVCVEGGASDRVARDVSESIAGSSLVKTAFHGGDPNWGRIFSAIGATGHEIDPGNLTISIDGHRVYDREPRPVPETLVEEMREQEEHRIQVDLGQGSAYSTRWTCDLSEEYVTINADYHS